MCAAVRLLLVKLLEIFDFYIIVYLYLEASRHGRAFRITKKWRKNHPSTEEE